MGDRLTIAIRSVNESDAEALLALRLRLDEETSFMMFEPGERPLDAIRERALIATVLRSDNQAIFVAEHEQSLIGLVEAAGGMFRRNRHSVQLVIGVLQSFAGTGVGTRLLSHVEAWARERRVHRLELTVMTHNAPAIRLYQKMGYTIEGTRTHSLLVNGAYVDEYAMAKLLSS